MVELTPIVLIDSHEFRRVAFTNLLAPLLSDMNVVLFNRGSIESLASLQQSLAPPVSAPPLFILNGGMAGLASAGLRAEIGWLRELFRDCRLLVLLESSWDGEIGTASSLGINGVISTCMPARNAVAAIEVALVGGTYFPRVVNLAKAEPPLHAALPDTTAPRSLPEPVVQEPRQALLALDQQAAITERLLSAEAILDPKDFELAQLSPRQMDVLKTIQAGMSNKEIARALGLAEATVKIHVRHLMRKFGAGNRTQVAVLSRYQGMVGNRAN